ncbi:mitochondrial inner membrane OXA1L-like insertase [Chloropicon primus]|uniref:Mitochondrial inner membrane OXA1L-like insertase n=1 Tax=Chloropicon primus TaxID=1764295 RepID=A0A5B8MD49_9CHLO|nr:mitochondrial inner membrane OXA1L-like insertase [Chloropicon primus]|eukprot:QDZ18044.1 mitochondrial inner membrane OXA1L-like insertase [Chloropicon primus]
MARGREVWAKAARRVALIAEEIAANKTGTGTTKTFQTSSSAWGATSTGGKNAWKKEVFSSASFGTWASGAPKGSGSGLIKLVGNAKGIGRSIGRVGLTRQPLSAAALGSTLLSKRLYSSSVGGGEEREEAGNLAAQGDIDFGAVGDIGAVVNSSIKDVELALIADSGYWTPVQACFNYFHTLHWTFDLSWVGAVAVGTMLVRAMLSPVNVEQMRMAERMAIAKPEIDQLTAQAKEAASKGGQDAQYYSTEMQKLWKKHGVHPGRALGANLIVLPTMLLLPITVLNLPKLGLPSLSAESFFWVQDISVADPLYILPVASSALFFAAIQFNMSPESMTPQMQKILPVFKILPIAFLPITVNLPALFHFFGLTSIVFQTGQTMLLKNQAVRNYLGFKGMPRISEAEVVSVHKPRVIQEAEIVQPPKANVGQAETVPAPPKPAASKRGGKRKKKQRKKRSS